MDPRNGRRWLTFDYVSIAYLSWSLESSLSRECEHFSSRRSLACLAGKWNGKRRRSGNAASFHTVKVLPRDSATTFRSIS